MSSKKTLEAVSILTRVKVFTGMKTDTELAKALNIRQSTVASWRSRGNLNLPAIISLCDGANLNWLLYGVGSMRTGDLDPVSGKVVAMLEEMDEEQRRDVLRYTEKEKFFQELKNDQKKAM